VYNILLAEDEKWVRIALKKVIEQTGLPFKVAYEAGNGMEASDWLDGNQIDLVLSDIRMPIMDGIALLEYIQKKSDGIDVIVISGHDDFVFAQKALRLGAFDYMLKPVEADALRDCLQRWINTKGIKHAESFIKAVPAVDEKELSPIEIVIRHMESAAPTGLTLTDAASLVHLNPSYFCKLFKQQMGVNFTDFVTSTRMKEAVRLLEKTSLRVSEIADRLGYADLAYFSNTFKKTMSMTPSDYRKQMQTSIGNGG
jgi:YesN/AraC family two-component response regulator